MFQPDDIVLKNVGGATLGIVNAPMRQVADPVST
jgi:hypothetical protein